MVKDHSDNQRGNLLLPLHGLLFSISNKGSFHKTGPMILLCITTKHFHNNCPNWTPGSFLITHLSFSISSDNWSISPITGSQPKPIGLSVVDSDLEPSRKLARSGLKPENCVKFWKTRLKIFCWCCFVFSVCVCMCTYNFFFSRNYVS